MGGAIPHFASILSICQELLRKTSLATQQVVASCWRLQMWQVAWHINHMKWKDEHAVHLQEIQSLLTGRGLTSPAMGSWCLKEPSSSRVLKRRGLSFSWESCYSSQKKKEDMFTYKTHILWQSHSCRGQTKRTAQLQCLPLQEPQASAHSSGNRATPRSPKGRGVLDPAAISVASLLTI